FGKGVRTDLTLLYLSKDRGDTWSYLSEVKNQRGSKLFVHREYLYLVGTNRNFGKLVIRRSADGGLSWTEPSNVRTGILLDGNYHTSPVPVLVHNGRIYWTLEEQAAQTPRSGFQPFIISASVNANLLHAESWRTSNRAPYQREWGGMAWTEGSLVPSPTGSLVNILRHHHPSGNQACMMFASPDGSLTRFDPQVGYINFPGGGQRFTIRYDPKSQMYWALTNAIPKKYATWPANRVRNTLTLMASRDLRNWEIRSVLLYESDPRVTGFQQADWYFDRGDIVAVIQTAFDDGVGGPAQPHYANFLTFHRFKNFARSKGNLQGLRF
ncbi:MAG: sialidase family protein, partial [Bacteroidota bacterium]